MLHPSILAAYLYRRNECQSNPIDACSDVALFDQRVSMQTLARFLITMGIDADRLHLLA